MSDNPYALREVSVDGVKIMARPYEFTGEGEEMVPTMLSTTCPTCGHGIWFATAETVECPTCKERGVPKQQRVLEQQPIERLVPQQPCDAPFESARDKFGL